MTRRPLSDRRHRQLTAPGACWEVRGWTPPSGPEPDERGWRTLAWSPSHEDAVMLATALVQGSGHPLEYVEVWGPEDEDGGRSHVCERFPEPSSDERREMWLRAATEHFSDSLDLMRRG